MEGYYIKKVGQNRGAPRVWLEGTETQRAGFAPGQRYDIEVQGQMIVLQANKDGSRVVSGKVAGERNNPIIDINSKALLAMFDGMAAIRVVVKQDQIYLMPLASEVKKLERFGRLRSKLENGDAISIGSLSHGGGVMSHAIHSGLEAAGVKARLAFANEIRPELLEHAALHNDAWSSDTTIVAAPMQEFAFDDRGVASLPKVEILEVGIPCSGASKAGKSKRGLAHPEAHPEVGHLIVAAIVIVHKSNPAIFCIECVPAYQNSASAEILRTSLHDMGYNTHERILNGKEWGALENRDRWCMLGVTVGLDIDFDQLQPPGASPQLIADVLDKSIGPDDSNWREFGYLKVKEVRDAEKGNSFGMQVVSEVGDSVPTLRKGYAKGGSTDPLLQHPTDPDLLRQFTPEEHASIKGIPSELIAGLSPSIAHQVLGQSVIYAPFKGVGMLMGDAINRFMDKPSNRLLDGKMKVVLPQITRSASKPVRAAASVVSPKAPSTAQAQLGFDDVPMSPVVTQGEFSGLVLTVADNIVTQKINRDGRTAQHDARKLTALVAPGDVVEIKYVGDVGTVGGKAVAAEVGR